MNRIRIVIAIVALMLVVPSACLPRLSGDVKRPCPRSSIRRSARCFSTDKQVLYHWQVEKKAGGKCAASALCEGLAAADREVGGSCAEEDRRAQRYLRHDPAADGKLQVTRNKLPVYTYAHEGPRQVLCDNVNGWFVVRL